MDRWIGTGLVSLGGGEKVAGGLTDIFLRGGVGLGWYQNHSGGIKCKDNDFSWLCLYIPPLVFFATGTGICHNYAMVNYFIWNSSSISIVHAEIHGVMGCTGIGITEQYSNEILLCRYGL